ncbi:fimbrial protein [Parabacteroides sp.]
MKTFNKLYGVSLLSFLLSVAACTSETEEQIEKPSPEPSGKVERREVLLTLKNKLSVTATKADPIATADENKISSLDVYIFGSETEGGTYTYQERFCYRENTADMPYGNDVTALDLLVKDAEAKETTALLSLRKGLFVKLYCIANQSRLLAADGTPIDPMTTFQALQQSNPGQKDNTVSPGSPEEADFLKYHTPLIDPASTTDILVTPLPMTGAYTTPLDLTDFSVSARLQLGFKLTRAVARFDIVNDATTSRFTLQSVSMAQGRKGVSFFPLKVIGTLPDAAAGDLITYPARKFEGDNANAGTTTGAFYSYPSPVEDGGYLILNGTYAANNTENIPVTYKVPFKPAGDGNYIEVSQNHRYTVNITKADEYHLDFTIDVADWTDEGTIDDYTPGGEADENGISVNVAGDVDYDVATRTVTMPIVDDTQFTIEGGSGAGYYTRMYYENEDTEHQWLIMDPPADNMVKADAAPVTYTIKKDNDYKETKYPVAFIRFTDKISTKETIVIVQPLSKPTISGTSSSAGCSFLDNNIILYQADVKNPPSMKLSVFASGGSELSFTSDGSSWSDWLTVTPSVKQDASKAEYVMTLNSSSTNFPNPYPLEGTDFYIINQGDKTKEERVNVKLSSLPVIEKSEIVDAGFSSYNTSSKTMYLFDDNSSVKLTVSSLGGCKVANVPSWMTVTPGDIKNTMEITFKQTSSGTAEGVSAKIEIQNLLDNTRSIFLTVYQKLQGVRLQEVTGSNKYSYLESDIIAETPTVVYYPTQKNYFEYKVRSPFGISVSKNANWINTPSLTTTETLSNGDVLTTIKVTMVNNPSATICNTRRKTGTITMTATKSNKTKTMNIKTEYPTFNAPNMTEPPLLASKYSSYWVSPYIETVTQGQYSIYKNSCPEGWGLISTSDITYLFAGTSLVHPGAGRYYKYSNGTDQNYAVSILGAEYTVVSDAAGYFFRAGEGNNQFSLGVATGTNGISLRCWRQYNSSSDK